MNYNELLQQILYLVITGVLPILTLYIVTLLKVKIKDTTKEMENKQLEKYIDSATEAISIAVISTSQVYVDVLKQAGKFDKESQIKAKNMAIENAKAMINEDVQKAIETVYGDYTTYLSNQIEALVRESKIVF